MFVELGLEELEFRTKEKKDLKADLKERDLKNPGDRHSLDHRSFLNSHYHVLLFICIGTEYNEVLISWFRVLVEIWT